MRRVLLPLLALLVLAAPARADWLQRALSFQYELGSSVPLRNAPWVGTHNSFNKDNSDPNQRLSLVDQLRAGARSLELDVHAIKGVPLVCHALGSGDSTAGCTGQEPTFAARLHEIRGWVKAHPKQVLLLYVEDHMEGVYDVGAKMLDDELGPYLYKPPAGTCTGMPLSTSRDDIRAAGKRVLVISSCAEASERSEVGAWRGLVFDDAARERYEATVHGFDVRFPDCDYQHRFQRFYEDSTRVAAQIDKQDGVPPAPLTPAVTRAMERCGVDLISFDQLTTGDPRLRATIWSWAKGQPAGHGCVSMASRFRVSRCGRKLPFACKGASGKWRTTRAVRWADRPKRCRRGLPRTGYEAAKLREVTGGDPVWLKLRA